METQEHLFIKGFNSGYILAKHMPILLLKIVKNVSPAGDFIEGLFSGKEEYELEYSRNQGNDLSRLRNASKSQDKGLERD